MFPVAAGDRYKWPLLAVLSHAEQPNESAGGLKNSPQHSPAPSTRFSPSNSLSLSTSITQFKTEAIPVLNSVYIRLLALFLLFPPLCFSIHHSPDFYPSASVVTFAYFSQETEV